MKKGGSCITAVGRSCGSSALVEGLDLRVVGACGRLGQGLDRGSRGEIGEGFRGGVGDGGHGPWDKGRRIANFCALLATHLFQTQLSVLDFKSL